MLSQNYEKINTSIEITQKLRVHIHKPRMLAQYT